MKTTYLIGLLSVLGAPVLAQTQPETGAGNPMLSCTAFLDLDEAAQSDAVATLMTVGSNEMPSADAGMDSGAVGSMTSSDAAAAPMDSATATENADTGADNMGVMAEVSPDMVRAMVNICSNSAEPS